jgi:hypothetical protein
MKNDVYTIISLIHGWTLSNVWSDLSRAEAIKILRIHKLTPANYGRWVLGCNNHFIPRTHLGEYVIWNKGSEGYWTATPRTEPDGFSRKFCLIRLHDDDGVNTWENLSAQAMQQTLTASPFMPDNYKYDWMLSCNGKFIQPEFLKDFFEYHPAIGGCWQD